MWLTNFVDLNSTHRKLVTNPSWRQPMELCPPPYETVPPGLDDDGIFDKFSHATSLFISRHPLNRFVSGYFNYKNTAYKDSQEFT